MKKIVIIAPVHPWDDVRIFKKQAISLSKEGFNVTIIASATKAATECGVSIIPVKGKFTTRTQRFLSLPIIAIQGLRLKADIYHLHNPDTIPIAWFLRLLGKKVIYDTHEDFSERILMREWIPKPLRPIIAKTIHSLERITAKICSATIATQPDLVEKLGSKCILIGNPPRINTSLYEDVQERSKLLIRGEELRLVYIGSISKFRGLFEMIEALNILNKKEHINCRLWLIGPCNIDDIEGARQLSGWRYVDYLENMPQEQAFAYICKSDIGMVYINDVGDHRKSDANKIYEYMSFSIPFIASDFPIWKKRLAHTEAGLFVPTESPELLAEAITKFYKMPQEERLKMGVAGKKYLHSYNWDKEFIKLETIYYSLLKIKK